MTLTEFLLARIAEDEAVAREAAPGHWSYSGGDSVGAWTLYDSQWSIASMTVYEEDVRRTNQPLSNKPGSTGPAYVDPDANGRHIARHDPARVLAECKAKRYIVDIHSGWHACPDEDAVEDDDATEPAPCLTLRILAAVHADHPDYRREWRP